MNNSEIIKFESYGVDNILKRLREKVVGNADGHIHSYFVLAPSYVSAQFNVTPKSYVEARQLSSGEILVSLIRVANVTTHVRSEVFTMASNELDFDKLYNETLGWVNLLFNVNEEILNR